jgi:hypothetical protein
MNCTVITPYIWHINDRIYKRHTIISLAFIQTIIRANFFCDIFSTLLQELLVFNVILCITLYMFDAILYLCALHQILSLFALIVTFHVRWVKYGQQRM